MMLELIGAARSVFVRATRLALEEKGVPYTLVHAMPRAPEVLAANPFGKIPVMRHGDVLLFESLAIMIYADRTFVGPKLFPDDARAVASVVQWASAIGSTVFPALAGYMRANAFPPDGVRDMASIDNLLPQMQTQIDILDRAVAATGNLAGHAFTPADMYLMPMLAYLRVFPESAAMIAHRNDLARYFDRHAARASFRATEPDDVSAP